MVLISTIFLIVSAVFVFTSLEDPSMESPFNFTYNLSEEIYFDENEEPVLSEEGLERLKAEDAWLQILDHEGYVVESYNTIPKLADHYTPFEINLIGASKSFRAYYAYNFGVTNEDINYIVAYPNEEWFSLEGFEIDRGMMRQFGEYMLALTFIILLIMGFIFSQRIAKPVSKIIRGVEGLAEGNYSINYKEKGLYKPVFRQLNQLANRLESSEIEREKTRKLREKWISNMSHDLKTPLSSIKGYSEILADAEYNLTPDEISKYSETIHEKSLYMEEMIEELRLNERLMHDAIALNKEKKNLTSFIREIVIDSLNHPEYSDRSIVFQTTEEEIEYAFDGELMWRCIENLIFNALIHNDEETEVIVRLEKLPDHIFIEIEDNGRGMTDEELEQLFNRYYRGSNTDNYKGTGLGMSIAKEVIEAHDGEIQVESEVDKGTKIRILL